MNVIQEVAFADAISIKRSARMVCSLSGNVVLTDLGAHQPGAVLEIVFTDASTIRAPWQINGDGDFDGQTATIPDGQVAVLTLTVFSPTGIDAQLRFITLL